MLKVMSFRQLKTTTQQQQQQQQKTTTTTGKANTFFLRAGNRVRDLSHRNP